MGYRRDWCRPDALRDDHSSRNRNVLRVLYWRAGIGGCVPASVASETKSP